MDQTTLNPLNETVSKIVDPVFHQLADELDGAVGLALDRDQMVINYLAQVVYPMGADKKRYKIDGKVIIPSGMLDSQLGKLSDHFIYQICDRLAGMRGESVELYEKKKLYVCLNSLIRDQKRKRREVPIHPRDIPHG